MEPQYHHQEEDNYTGPDFPAGKPFPPLYSKRNRAGKRRTYFFDLRATRNSNDYYLTITESRKKINEGGYERHKISLYKEDFNKFLKALTEAVNYVKTELMPDFDFDAYNHNMVTDNESVLQEEPAADDNTDIRTTPTSRTTPTDIGQEVDT